MESADARKLDELRRRYLANQVETASPARRLLLLFDALLCDLKGASDAFGVEAGPPGGAVPRIEEINRLLLHAQEIVLVLRGSLADSEWQAAEPLRAVYRFVYDRLVQCNLRKDPSLLSACVSIVTQVRDANVRATETLERTETTGAPPARGDGSHASGAEVA